MKRRKMASSRRRFWDKLVEKEEHLTSVYVPKMTLLNLTVRESLRESVEERERERE